MIDVVMPNGNEERLIGMAERLGFASLCLFYGRAGRNEISGLENLQKKTGIRLYIGSLSEGIVFGDISREDISRIASDRRVDVVFGFESMMAKDRLSQKSSGLDPVICRELADGKKIFCADFGRILQLSRGARAAAFGRLGQNLMLCRKYKIKAAIASFANAPLKMRNPSDMSAFLAALGHDDGKRPLEAIEERAVFRQKKREGKIIREGVEMD